MAVVLGALLVVALVDVSVIGWLLYDVSRLDRDIFDED